MITQATASRIWIAYNEIEKAEKLIAEMEEAARAGRDPNPRDPFGQRRNLQLGVPYGSDNAHRLFDVRPELAKSVIRAHIAEKQADLVAANEQARIELTAPENQGGSAA